MKLLKKIKIEFLHLLPITTFFFIGFTLIVITECLNLHEHGMPLTGLGVAAIGALLVGKVVLITDSLSFMYKFSNRPLVFNIVWQSSIYFLVTSALAMKLQNSVSNLFIVPFQNNWDFGAGSANALQYKVNLQPVIPFSIGEDWILIARTFFRSVMRNRQ